VPIEELGREEGVLVPIVYVGAEDVPILLANQFIIQHEQSEFILTLGQMTPPILLGTPEERREQAQKLAYIPVKIVARIAFTRDRLVELIQMLEEHLRKFDKQRGEER